MTSVVVRGKLIPGVQKQEVSAMPDQIVKKAQETAKYFELIQQHKQQIERLIQEAVDNDEYELADRYLNAGKKLDGLYEALE